MAKVPREESTIDLPQHDRDPATGIDLPRGVPVRPQTASTTQAPADEPDDFDYSTLPYAQVLKLAQAKALREGKVLQGKKTDQLIDYLKAPEIGLDNDPAQTGRPEDGINHIQKTATGPTKEEVLARLKGPSEAKKPDTTDKTRFPRGIKTEAQASAREEALARIRRESEDRVDIDAFLDAMEEDPLFISPELVPDGFTVEWKTTHIMGQPIDTVESGYTSNLALGGWMPCPVEIMPSLVPPGYEKPYIERPGNILMIREAKHTKRVHDEAIKRSREHMNDKVAQMYDTPKGTMDRFVNKFETSTEARGPSIPK